MILGVVKLAPLPMELPPVEAAYQEIVPEDAVAPKVTVPVPQREPVLVPVRVDDPELTVMVIAVLVAVVGAAPRCARNSG